MLELTPDELLTTTRAVRKRLDFDRPVEREVINESLEIAMQAPTGSNMQMWKWLVLDDEPEKKAVIAKIYLDAFKLMYGGEQASPYRDGDSRGERADAVKSSAEYLAENLAQVPVWVIPCHKGRVTGDNVAMMAGYWGSIYPAVWNFQLALRARGLGSTLTTLHLLEEEKSAEILGIPFEQYTQAALIPVAYTKGTDFKPAPRNDPDRFIRWNTW